MLTLAGCSSLIGVASDLEIALFLKHIHPLFHKAYIIDLQSKWPWRRRNRKKYVEKVMIIDSTKLCKWETEVLPLGAHDERHSCRCSESVTPG